MTETIRKKSKWIKYLKYTIISIASLVMLFVLFGVIVTLFYEKEIKEYAIKQINNELKTEIKVKEIDLSLLKRFPYASLTFHEVEILEPVEIKNRKNFVVAEKIYLQFNIWDIFDGNYKIKNLELANSTVDLRLLKNGSTNFDIFKSSTDSTSSNFEMALQKVILENVNFKYTDEQNNDSYEANIEKALFKGDFSEEKFTIRVGGKFDIKSIIVSKELWIKNHKLSADFEMEINRKANSLSFNKTNILLNNTKYNIDGSIAFEKAHTTFDLKLKSSKTNLKSLLDILPQFVKSYLSDFDMDGEIVFATMVKGKLSQKSAPLININFEIADAFLTNKKSDEKLTNVSVKGNYTNGSSHNMITSFLDVKNFNAELGNGKIHGVFNVKNFISPEISLKTSINVNLKDITSLFKQDYVQSSDGNASLEFQFDGKLANNNKITKEDFVNSSTEGILNISDWDFVVNSYKKEVKNLSGVFNFNNNDVVVQKCSGEFENSDFNFSGYFKNLIPYFFNDKENLYIQAKLKSDYIKVEDLISSDNNSKDTAYTLIIPENIKLTTEANIEKLSFDKFEAENISGNFKLNNQIFDAKNVSCNAMDGKFELDGVIDGSNAKDILITCNFKAIKVNVQKMFSQMNNFGQKSLQSKHIKGQLTSDVQFAAVFDKHLKINLKKIYTLADIKIEKGELIKYEPMKSLSSFLRLEDLEHITFSTLHNQIEIKDGVINMPMMDINSSAINIKATGTHSFDNEINYRLQILLSDLLSKKFKKNKKENDEEFGKIEEDGEGKTTIFLVITGTVDNPIVKYDGKSVKEKIVAKFLNEKKVLKKILKEEFHWFTKDTTIYKENKDLKDKNKNNNDEEKTKFEIEGWE